jgi:hypothetical protein
MDRHRSPIYEPVAHDVNSSWRIAAAHGAAWNGTAEIPPEIGAIDA